MEHKSKSGKLILVRHGESEGNRDRRFTTSGEAQLTELGRQQAREAAERIRAMFAPSLVVASPYSRARETGEIIARGLKLGIVIEDNLHEQSFGKLRGESYDAVQFDKTRDPSRPWLWRPPEGESLVDVQGRVGPVLDKLAAAHAGGEIVVVSHGGVMAALWAYVTGNWEKAHVPPNTGIVLVEHAHGAYSQPRVITDGGEGTLGG